MKTTILSLLFLAACATGPDPLDVQADRDRWTAVRDTTADGAVTPNEAPLLAELLVAWDQKLTADEVAAKRARDPKAVMADLLRVYGTAALTVFGADLAVRAPEAFRLADANSDGMLSVEELTTLDPANPVVALAVTQTVVAMLRKR